MSEDVVCRAVFLGERKETFRVGGSIKDVSPREASCRDNVLGGDSSVNNLSGIVARGPLVVLETVFVLFTPVRPLPKVVTAAKEVRSSVLDWLYVGVASVEVEDVEWVLESLFKTDDDMVVDTLLLVIFLTEFKPVFAVRKVVEEVGEFGLTDVGGLRICEEETLTVGAGRSRHF